MITPLKITNKIIYILLFFIAVFYLLFPTNNSSLDAYSYAADIKYGENLFEPHHLLYNWFQFFIYKVFSVFTKIVDLFLLTKAVNSLFVIFNLIIFSKILEHLFISKKEIFILLIIIAFSHSSLRYGTENETYIIPITFSLLGSYYFLKHLRLKKVTYLFLSGFFASLACLFHQIHFFWWLGLLIGIILYAKHFKNILFYSAPVIIVPIVYMLILFFYNQQDISLNNILHFIFHDYFSGSARSEFGLMNFIFIIISSLRTFIQIHPNIIFLIKYNVLFIIPLLILLILFYKILKVLIEKHLLSKRKNLNASFANTHLLILILHLVFSFYAVGNVEFLVMTPFLIFLSVFYIYKVDYKVLVWTSVTFFIWNFSFGLYPNNRFNYYNDEVLINFMKDHPNKIFIVKNQSVLSEYHYKMGKMPKTHIFYSSDVDIEYVNKILEQKGQSYFYTDIIDKPEILNRAKLLEDNNLDLSEFKKVKIKNYSGLYGTSTIYKVYLDN
ncbi:MAG: hypothetical protein KDC74_12630 [Flavobacteriaceae bacterium]|nr:hypothetical protein [Flavobacteriaceae bacterium]